MPVPTLNGGDDPITSDLPEVLLTLLSGLATVVAFDSDLVLEVTVKLGLGRSTVPTAPCSEADCARDRMAATAAGDDDPKEES